LIPFTVDSFPVNIVFKTFISYSVLVQEKKCRDIAEIYKLNSRTFAEDINLIPSHINGGTYQEILVQDINAEDIHLFYLFKRSYHSNVTLKEICESLYNCEYADETIGKTSWNSRTIPVWKIKRI